MNRGNELSVPYPILDWLVKVLHQIYSIPVNANTQSPTQKQQQQQQTKLIFHDVVVALQKYLNNPLKIKTKVFIHNTGESELLLCLHGVFATVPLLIYVPKDYPEVPPFVMIDEEQWNQIVQEQHQEQQKEQLLWIKQQLSRYVDNHTGFLYVSSVLNWNNTAEKSLLKVVDDTFSLLNMISNNYQKFSTSTSTSTKRNSSLVSPFSAHGSTSNTGSPPPIPFRPDAKSPIHQSGNTGSQTYERRAGFTFETKEHEATKSGQELSTSSKQTFNSAYPLAGPPLPPPRPDRPRTSALDKSKDNNLVAHTEAPKSNTQKEKTVFSSIVPDLMDLDISSSSSLNAASFASDTSNTKLILTKTINSLGQDDKETLSLQYANKLKEMDHVFTDFTKVHDYQTNLIATQKAKVEQWVLSLNEVEQKMSETTRRIIENGFPIQIEDSFHAEEEEEEEEEEGGKGNRVEKSPIKDWQNVCIDIAYESCYEKCLLGLRSKDRALDDCIYLMTKKAINKSTTTEMTPSNNAVFCLKKIRELARQQFMARYEINKLSTVIKEGNSTENVL
ncbi:hypothetical protein ACO0QE_003976 [Hanseniaspora vineae]